MESNVPLYAVWKAYYKLDAKNSIDRFNPASDSYKGSPKFLSLRISAHWLGFSLMYLARRRWVTVSDNLQLLEQVDEWLRVVKRQQNEAIEQLSLTEVVDWLKAEIGLPPDADPELDEFQRKQAPGVIAARQADGCITVFLDDEAIEKSSHEARRRIEEIDAAIRNSCDTVPIFPKPTKGKIDNAIAALYEGLENVDPLPNGVFSKRADLLAKDVCNDGHTKAAAQWAIQTLIDDGILVVEIRHWGGVIGQPWFGAPKPIELHANGNASSEKKYRLAFDQFNVVYQLDKERKPFPESWAESDLRLSDVRMVLEAHSRRCRQGFSPVADMVAAVDRRLQQLRVAAVKCGILASGATLTPETLGTIVNKLIEVGTIAAVSEGGDITLEMATAALQAGDQGAEGAGETTSQCVASHLYRQQTVSQLERETPPLSTESKDWLRAKEIVGEKSEDVSRGTLAKYRLESEGGIQTQDKMLGRDKDGRVWRRTGTPTSHIWYLRKTLLGKLRTCPKP